MRWLPVGATRAVRNLLARVSVWHPADPAAQAGRGGGCPRDPRDASATSAASHVPTPARSAPREGPPPGCPRRLLYAIARTLAEKPTKRLRYVPLRSDSPKSQPNSRPRQQWRGRSFCGRGPSRGVALSMRGHDSMPCWAWRVAAAPPSDHSGRSGACVDRGVPATPSAVSHAHPRSYAHRPNANQLGRQGGQD